MSRLTFVLVILFLLTGCTAWKSFQAFYHEYIDVSPKIDLQTVNTGNEPEQFFARIIYPVDLQLNKLMCRLDEQDTYPHEKWFNELLKDFPWLSGVAAIDRSGQILFQLPAHLIKPVNYSLLFSNSQNSTNDYPATSGSTSVPARKDLLFAGDSVRASTDIKIVVQDSEFGPEIYLARPFFKNNLAQGMLVIHFDAGSWARLSAGSQELAIFVGDKPVWVGKRTGLNKYCAQIKSIELLKNGVSGQINMKSRFFYWLARAAGENWIIYLTQFSEFRKLRNSKSEYLNPKPQHQPST